MQTYSEADKSKHPSLINKVVGGEGVRSHTSKLRKFFVMPLALSILIFNKGYDRTRTLQILRFPIVVTVLTMEFLRHIGCDLLLKIGVLRAKCIKKTFPT